MRRCWLRGLRVNGGFDSLPGQQERENLRESERRMMMKTYKIELTKAQNWMVVNNAKDEELVWLAKFGGMARDYTYWLVKKDLQAVTEVIGESPVILREVD